MQSPVGEETADRRARAQTACRPHVREPQLLSLEDGSAEGEVSCAGLGADLREFEGIQGLCASPASRQLVLWDALGVRAHATPSGCGALTDCS